MAADKRRLIELGVVAELATEVASQVQSSGLQIGTTGSTAMAGNRTPTATIRGGVLQQPAIADLAGGADAATIVTKANALLATLRTAGGDLTVDYAWIEIAPGRMRYRKVRDGLAPQRSTLPCPRIVRPFSSPVQSMADGKFYDDPASLRATYRAENNPQGVDFIEVGNEDLTRFTPPPRDRKANRDAIERAICEVESGNVPPVLTQLPG